MDVTTTTNQSDAVILLPWFGPWPKWFSYFLESCRHNSTFRWTIFTDNAPPSGLPDNVVIVPMTLPELEDLVEEKLGQRKRLRHGRHVCDLKIAYGHIFEEFVPPEFSYWAYGDADLIYGNLRECLKGIIHQYDVITFHKEYFSGHLTLFRTGMDKTKYLYREITDFFAKLQKRGVHSLSEPVLPGGIPWRSSQSSIPMDSLGLTYFANEGYTTPHTFKFPWFDGTYRFPTEWRWEGGRLTNNLDGNRQFPYFHFLYWKGRPGTNFAYDELATWSELNSIEYTSIDEIRASGGFRINKYGFQPLNENRAPDFKHAYLRRHLKRMKTYVELQVKPRARIGARTIQR